MSKSAEHHITNQLCFSIYNTSRLFTKFYHQTLAEFELTYPQYLVLLSLWEKDHQHLHEIGKALNLTSNTLTPLLKRMEQADWLKREQIEGDKRQLLISLTDKGREHEMIIHKRIENCISDFDIDYDFLQQAHAVTQQLERELKEIVNK